MTAKLDKHRPSGVSWPDPPKKVTSRMISKIATQPQEMYTNGKNTESFSCARVASFGCSVLLLLLRTESIAVCGINSFQMALLRR